MSVGRQSDLSLCEREPIHTPCAIQPQGAPVAALADTMRVTHAGATRCAFLGQSAEAVLGQSAEAVLGQSLK